jgi:predicted ATP pyrophosphatase (TIGR00289 family)
MKIPQLSISSGSDDVDVELSALRMLLQKAKKQFGIEGVVHGGIQSNFQKDKFETLCSELNLIPFTPLWGTDSRQYMDDLLDSNFDFIMTTVSSGGLDGSWLGKLISKPDIDVLDKLSKEFGFNLNFEGGEAETFVIDCPLFTNPIKIIQSKKNWDGYRGRFEIVDAKLNCNA